MAQGAIFQVLSQNIIVRERERERDTHTHTHTLYEEFVYVFGV